MPPFHLWCERIITNNGSGSAYFWKICKSLSFVRLSVWPFLDFLRELTVHGINSDKVVDTQMLELKLTPVHSGGSCSSFTVKPYVQDQLTIGNDVIDVDELKTRYPT